MPADANVRTKDRPRGRVSCLPCRRLKHKCDKGPEHSPCTRCICRQVECIWPTEDKRTTRFRPEKADLTDQTDAFAINHEGSQASRDAGEVTEPSVATTSFMALPSDDEPHSTRPAPEHDGIWLDWLVGDSEVPFTTSSGLLSGMRSDEEAWASSLGKIIIAGGLPVAWNWAHALDGSTSSEPAHSTGYAFPLPLSQSSRALNIGGPSSRMIRIKWSRPHGRTAFMAGRLPMTLDVMLSPHAHGPAEIDSTAPHGMSPVGGANDTALKKHLIDLFETRFGAEFPYLDLNGMREDVDADRGSRFLLLAVCGLAASDNPVLAKPDLAPYEYGESYIEQAKAMIGSIMAVPIRETVIGLVLLTYGISWKGVASEFWMLSGMAIRLAIDMGLHLSPGPGTSDDDARKDRLVFWSVMALDLAVSFGVGRTTTISPLSVTQSTPDFDISDPLPSPLVHLAGLILPLARINNALNLDDAFLAGTPPDVEFLKSQVVGMYGSLPSYLAWSTKNLRDYAHAGQATIFLACHLWVHAILLTEVRSTNCTLVPEDIPSPAIKPDQGQDALSSAEAICEMLAACEVFYPEPYLTFPFISQALYNAAMVFIEVIENARQSTHGSTVGIRVTRALAKLAIIQNVFVHLGRYWPGCKLIASAVEQRIAGQEHVSFVSDDASVVVPRIIGPGLLPTRFAGNMLG